MHTVQKFFGVAGYRVYLAGLFLLPTAVVWSNVIPTQPLKMSIAALALVGASALAVLGAFKRGGVSIPLNLSLLAVWLIPVAYFAASIFSPSFVTSLVGASLDSDTVFFMAMAALAFSVPFYVFESKTDHMRALFVLLAVAWITALFHLARLFFGADTFAFDVMTNPLFSPLGKWNDVGIFFGLVSLLSLVSFESLHLKDTQRYIVAATLAVSLFFVALVNFVPVWVMLCVASLGIVLYRFMVARESGQFSVAATIVFCLALVALIFTGSIGASLARSFNVEQIEARPSWGSTIAVAQQTLAKEPVFGSGPNTFLLQWDMYRPRLINDSVFWNADFTSGVGLVPTSVVTTGLIGFVAWLLFFASLIWLGARALLFKASSDQAQYHLTLASYVGGMYLLVMSVVYLPSPQLILIGFALLGMFAVLAHREMGAREFEINFRERPRLGFIAVLALALTLVLSVVTVYGAGTIFASNVAFEKATRAAQVDGNLELALSELSTATSLSAQDRYYRFATLVHVSRLNTLLSTPPGSIKDDEAQQRFQSELGAAVESGLQAVRLNDTNYRNWQTLATAYQTVIPLNISGSYEAAVSALKSAQAYNNTMPTIPLQRAQLEAAKGNKAAIRGFIEETLTLKQDFTPALLLLAQIELDGGNLKAAIERAESAAVFEPSNPVLHFQVGVLKFESKDLDGSLASFKRAVELAPDYANARYYLGRTYLAQGERDQALEQFTEVARLNPDNTEVMDVIEALKAGQNPFAPAPAPKK